VKWSGGRRPKVSFGVWKMRSGILVASPGPWLQTTCGLPSRGPTGSIPNSTPKTEEFCRHYGTVMLPTRPAMPRHKGKIESGINYG
jgi:hypothetical protein